MSTGSPLLNQDNAFESRLIGDPFNSVIDRFLDTVGDGSGTTPMNVAVADDFLIAPATDDYVYLIDELKIVLGDTAGAFTITGFGNGAALANGLDIEIRYPDGTIAKQLAQDITTNPELCALGTELFSLNNTLLSVTIRWPEPLRVYYQHPLVVQTRDNLAAMEYLKARAKGRSFRAR